jgi:hypothetical protein
MAPRPRALGRSGTAKNPRKQRTSLKVEPLRRPHGCSGRFRRTRPLRDRCVRDTGAGCWRSWLHRRPRRGRRGDTRGTHALCSDGRLCRGARSALRPVPRRSVSGRTRKSQRTWRPRPSPSGAGDQLLDLALAATRRGREQAPMVFGGQVTRQQPHRRHRQRSVDELLEDARERATRASRVTSAISAPSDKSEGIAIVICIRSMTTCPRRSGTGEKSQETA